jgi:hypothetical protein
VKSTRNASGDTTTVPPANGSADGDATVPGAVVGRLLERDGRQWYRIDRLDLMDPFLTTVVSDDDLWLFISSTGALTAGRVDADGAVLPYETDDRLHRAAGRTGPVTVLAREVDGARQVWRPFAGPAAAGCTRVMERDTAGAAIVLAETRHDWGATLRATWSPSPAYGWVRTVELVATADDLDVEVLDGLVDVVPAGVDARTNQLTSNLVDSYKRTERAPTGRATVHTLESLVTDRAEPAEALAATLVWSTGLPGADVHLDERVVDDVVRGRGGEATLRLTGRRGCHLLHGRLSVDAGSSAGWQLVVDTALGQAAVLDRLALAASPDAESRVAADVAAGHERLVALLDAADADQGTADPVADAHHRSNVMFNVMRGGLFPHGHDVPTGDLAAFVATRNREVAARHAELLAGLPAEMPVGEVVAAAEAAGDPDLLRLVLEHLPLTFSRRHGDPSRPWNRFAIRVRDDAGEPLLSYEGNWRDIFQNWEALLRSYPAFHQHVVTTFVDASTVDGHNPYRISRDGIDWEVPGEDEWSNIGYWGDHQLVYLLRLLRGWRSVDPAGAGAWLGRRLFTYADVPYRLAPHEEMVRAPRDTVSYDEERA